MKSVRVKISALILTVTLAFFLLSSSIVTFITISNGEAKASSGEGGGGDSGGGEDGGEDGGGGDGGGDGGGEQQNAGSSEDGAEEQQGDTSPETVTEGDTSRETMTEGDTFSNMGNGMDGTTSTDPGMLPMEPGPMTSIPPSNVPPAVVPPPQQPLQQQQPVPCPDPSNCPPGTNQPTTPPQSLTSLPIPPDGTTTPTPPPGGTTSQSAPPSSGLQGLLPASPLGFPPIPPSSGSNDPTRDKQPSDGTIGQPTSTPPSDSSPNDDQRLPLDVQGPFVPSTTSTDPSTVTAQSSPGVNDGYALAGTRHTPEQEALKDIVKDLTNGGRKPLTKGDAEAVQDLAKRVKYPGFRVKDDDLKTKGNHWKPDPVNQPEGQPHIHMPGIKKDNHIPVEPGTEVKFITVDNLAKAGAGAAVIFVTYQLFKWGAAILLSPATGGTSLGAAAVTP